MLWPLDAPRLSRIVNTHNQADLTAGAARSLRSFGVCHLMGKVYGAFAPAPLFCFRQFLSERLVGGLGLVLLIEDQGLACAFDEIGNP